MIRQFRVRVEAIALKEETIGEGTSAVAGNLLSHNPATHLWNPVLEVNPHSAEVGWIRHGANRVALTVGVEIPAGSVAREASVPPAKPGGEVDFKFFPQEVRDFGEVRCCPLFETWENYVPASEGKFFPLAGGLPLSGAAKLMYHVPGHVVARLANAATQCSEFMSAISGNIYPDRQDNQPYELVREMWESWAFNVRAHVISMIWPVTAMEYAGCEQPDNLGFVLTMLGYVNPSATAGLCAELLSGCKPNKISYIGVEGSRVVVLVGPSHRVTGSAGQSITEAKLQEQWTTIRTKLPAKTGEYALEVVEVEEETSVAELLRTVVSQKLADPVHAGAPAGAKDDIFIIFTKCLWLTEWRKSENTYGPSPDAGRIIDENIDAMKAFANKGGRSQAPTIILSGPGIVWHGTAMQEVATSFFVKCRDAGFPAYPSNAMWFGCSKKSLNGGVVGLERGGHQFMGLVSAFTDLVCVLRREYSMSDEVREALAIALDFLVEREDLLKPSESYLSAAKQCGILAGLTPVDRWSSSRAVRRRPKRLPQPVQELLGNSRHLAPTRETGRRRWLSASGPQRHPQRGGRGWAKQWRISASRLRVAAYRRLSAAIRGEPFLQSQDRHAGIARPRPVVRLRQAATGST